MLKATSKEPESRYATAQELADDLRRFVEDHPIQARRPTLSQRAVRWSRRHYWLVSRGIAASFAVLSITALLIFNAHLQEVKQRQRAERNMALALRVLDTVYLQYADDDYFQAASLGDQPPLAEKISPKTMEFLEQALSFYAQFASANRDEPSLRLEVLKAQIRVGECYSRLGGYAGAERAFNNAISLGEKLVAEVEGHSIYQDYLARAQAGLADLARRQGDHDQVIADTSRAIRLLDPKDAVPYYSIRGSAYIDKGEFDKGVADLKQAIRLQPDYAAAHNNLAIALYDQGRFEEAVTEFREAIRLQPANATVHSNLGVALENQGKLDEAITECREAMRLKPDNAFPHNNLGCALLSMERFEEAVTEFREAIRLQPDSATFHNNLGAALKDQGKLDEAIAELRKAIRLDPDFGLAHAELGGVLLEQGKLQESLEEFAKAKEFDQPDAPLIVVAHAAALLLAGKPEEYRRLCLEAIKRFGSSSNGNQRLSAARCCGLAPDGLPDGVEAAEAVKAAESGLAKCEQAGQKRSGWKIHAVGLTQLRAGQLDLAARRFRESLEAEPTWHAHFLNWLGLAAIHCRRGELDEARGWLAKATEYAKEYPEKYTRRGSNWAEGELLRREVENLLAAPQPQKDAAEPNQEKPAGESEL